MISYQLTLCDRQKHTDCVTAYVFYHVLDHDALAGLLHSVQIISLCCGFVRVNNKCIWTCRDVVNVVDRSICSRYCCTTSCMHNISTRNRNSGGSLDLFIFVGVK